MDNELVQKLFLKYVSKAECYIPDLAESCEDAENNDYMRMVTGDFMADHICDHEVRVWGNLYCKEFRAAANKIAVYYFGEE